jgi:hypothetical protein
MDNDVSIYWRLKTMRIVWRNTIVCLVVSVLFLIPISAVENIRRDDTDNIASTILDGGWLEERDGVKILHLSGSNYDMGYQQGYLLKDECSENLRAYFNTAEQLGISYEELVGRWNIMKEYIPQKYMDEMQGGADGSGIPFEQIGAAYMISTLFRCCGIAAWGSATVDGKLYHLRSHDMSMLVQDPVTGKCAHDNGLLVIRKPDNGYASIDVSFAGNVGCSGGINEKGIGIGLMTSFSDDETLHGTQLSFRIRMVLDHASTIEEALSIIDTNKTLGWNFIISDCKIPIAYAVEQTANLSYAGTWNDPVESTSPLWSMDSIVRRANFFIDPDLAATQRYQYDPTSFPRWVMWKLGIIDKDTYFVEFYHYKALSVGLEEHWGKLDLDTTMSIVRDVYNLNTDVIWFKILKKLFLVVYDWEIYTPWHQWAMCPETGDIAVSFAGGDKKAFENPVHYFNFYDLLDAEPP